MIYISGGLQEHIYINIHQTILNICILYIIAQFKNGEEEFSRCLDNRSYSKERNKGQVENSEG